MAAAFGTCCIWILFQVWWTGGCIEQKLLVQVWWTGGCIEQKLLVQVWWTGGCIEQKLLVQVSKSFRFCVCYCINMYMRLVPLTDLTWTLLGRAVNLTGSPSQASKPHLLAWKVRAVNLASSPSTKWTICDNRHDFWVASYSHLQFTTAFTSHVFVKWYCLAANDFNQTFNSFILHPLI